jgi:hypothetical protein
MNIVPNRWELTMDSENMPNNLLVESLRKEAFEVKNCFTQYSFQGIAFAAAVLG